MNFASDNVTPAAPELLQALLEANQGAERSYGDDRYTAALRERLNAVFERTVLAHPVSTGSAANSLALACLTPPWGAVYCHVEAHINTDECGAPEFFTGGAKLIPIEDMHGKITPAALEKAIRNTGEGLHHVQPAAVSLTQGTEAGTVYRPEEIRALAELAHARGLKVHMDGARFANALVHLGCSPAELTWKAGVDALSFGATKNGALGAEVVIFFDGTESKQFELRRKRAGHLLSKLRFVSAQLVAYLADDRWLGWARHANRMASQLGSGLADLRGAELMHPVEINEVFVRLPEPVIQGLEADGFIFYRWGKPDMQTVRLVTAWNTAEQDVARLVERAQHHARSR